MRLQSINDFKGFSGKCVFARRVGSNFTKQEKSTLTKFIVSDIGRKYVTLLAVYDEGKVFRGQRFNPETGICANAINNGFRLEFYDSEESITNEIEIESLRNDVIAFFRDYRVESKLVGKDDLLRDFWRKINE